MTKPSRTRQHALGAMLGATVVIAGATAWQPRWFPARLARYAAVAAFTFFGAAQAVESVGATGYDPTNSFAETARYRDIHDVANSSTTLAILLAMIASALVAFAFVIERVRGRRATSN